MKTIYLNDIEKQLPESWEEIDISLIPRFLELLFLMPETGETYHEILRLSLKLTKQAWRKMMQEHFGDARSEEVKDENAETLRQLLGMVSWAWTEALDKKPFEYIVPQIEPSNRPKGGVEKLYLPSEDFETMAWGELQDAFVHYEMFVKQTGSLSVEESEEYLDSLLATICRPLRKDRYKNDVKWDGDVRMPYNEFLVKLMLPSIKKLPYTTKLPVLLYFAGTMKVVLSRYEVGAGGEDHTGENGFENDEQEDYPGQSFEKNTHLLAQKGIFGNYDATRQKNCHNVLIFLEENKKDVEAEIERNKTSE